MWSPGVWNDLDIRLAVYRVHAVNRRSYNQSISAPLTEIERTSSFLLLHMHPWCKYKHFFVLLLPVAYLNIDCQFLAQLLVSARLIYPLLLRRFGKEKPVTFPFKVVRGEMDWFVAAKQETSTFGSTINPAAKFSENIYFGFCFIGIQTLLVCLILSSAIFISFSQKFLHVETDRKLVFKYFSTNHSFPFL